MTRLLVCYALFALVSTLWQQACAADKPIAIGHTEQLFLDDYVIEKTENIVRRVNAATKHGPPLVVRDQPWEKGRELVFGTVLYDEEDKVFKMWHYSDGDVAYLTSPDGLSWTKPELDVVVRKGLKTNLVIERPAARGKPGPFGQIYEVFNVVKDKRDPDPSRRYKMAALAIEWNYTGEHMDPYHHGQRRGLTTYVSPDGIHWKQETEWASYDICDGLSYFLWDERIGRFVAYGRTKLTPDKNDGRWKLWGWGRAVNRIESADFCHWSAGELVLAADAADPKGSEIYSLTVFPYAGLYIGLVQMFYGPPKYDLDIQLAVSRDGKRFARVEPRDVFLGEGPVGSWDRFNISIASRPLIVGDEIWIYYSGRTRRHSPYKDKDNGPRCGRIGLAKIKRGRFVSLEASFDGGTVLTKPLLLEGEQLWLNANAAYGSIQVELLDEQLNPIPDAKRVISGKDGLAVTGNFRARTIKALAGKPVRIRFTLRNAQLYGFRMK